MPPAVGLLVAGLELLHPTVTTVVVSSINPAAFMLESLIILFIFY
jgi:hypothetical protein